MAACDWVLSIIAVPDFPGVHFFSYSFPLGYVFGKKAVKFPVMAFFYNVENLMNYYIFKTIGTSLCQFRIQP